jgi:hypothetical protein
MIHVVFLVDVEPDPRILYQPAREDFAGTAEATRFMTTLRQELAAITGAPANFDWMLRMDAQIERVYGAATAVAERHAGWLAELDALGDGIGVHTHLYRWDEARGRWYIDHRDPSWPVQCLERSLAAYGEFFARPCRVHSFGDRWMDAASARRARALGIRVELTVEPGLRARTRFRFGEHLVGGMPDYRSAPRHPWQPAEDDFLRPHRGAAHGLWMLPVTTYRFPYLLDAGRVASLVRRVLVGDLPTTDDATQRWVRAAPAQKPWVFRQACGTIQPETVGRCLHFVVRSSEFLAPRTRESIRANLRWLAEGGLGESVRFVTACQAVASIEATA